MPTREIWEAFFDAGQLLDRLGVDAGVRDLAEFGCGYGTFTVAAAKRVSGRVYCNDIDPAMLAYATEKAVDAGLHNIHFELRDFMADGSGLADESMDFALLFNILHGEDPVALLAEAHRILVPQGRLGVIHWIHDAETPRGPPLAIRPTPAQCIDWARVAQFEAMSAVIDLPPYHYGIVLRKPRTQRHM